MKKTSTSLLLVMLICIGSTFAYGQNQRTVSGTVKDNTGQGLPGATVTEKGTSNKVLTDPAGNYTIKVAPTSSLVVSYIGFEPTEVVATDAAVASIVLVSNSKSLNEVVVTGFGTRKDTRKLAYAVQTIKGDDIVATNNPNIVNSLQGKVAGVMVNQGAGGPTSSSRIRIRGNTSISSNNTQPLFVVDGVLLRPGVTGADSWGDNQDFGNSVKDLNPDDYESFTVLKGSAATALYGSEGQNGVILITTKKGANRKGLGISVTHTESFDHAYKLYDLQNEYGSGIDPTFKKNGAGNDIIDPNWGMYFSYGPKFNGQNVTDLDGHTQKYVANNPLDFFQTGKYVNTNVAIEGGNEKTTFRFSYSNLANNSVMPNNKLGRNNFNFRATQKVGNYINVDVSANYTMTKANNPVRNGGNSNPLFAFTYNGTRSTDLDYWANNYIDTALGGRKQGAAKNPYGLSSVMWGIFQQNSVQNENNLRANVDVTANIAPWLSLLVRGNINNMNTDYETKQRGDGANFTGGYYGVSQSVVTQTRMQAILTASKQLGNDLFLSASAGGETYRDLGGKRTNANTDGGLKIPDQYTLANSLNAIHVDASNLSVNPKSRTDAAYIYADLTWKNMVTLTATGRNDWSSTLTYQDGHGDYSYFYPSVGLAYTFSEMPAFKSSIISFGKLRASYAHTGSGTSPFITNSTGQYTLASNFSAMYGGTLPVYTFSDATLANLNLKNQLTKELEFGANVKFFNNRLGIDVAYYKKNTYNQVIQLPTAIESGVGARIINAGNIQNQGIEIVLNGTPIKNKDFEWNTTVNFTRNRNKIIDLGPGVTSYQLELAFGADVQAVAIPGQDYGVVQTSYGYAAYQKKDVDGKPIADPNNGKKVIGNPAYADFGMTYLRNGTYDGSTKTLGTIMEKFLLSNLHNFRYKNFTLGLQVDAKVGGLMASGTHQYGSANGSLKNSLFGRDAEHGGIAYTDDQGNQRNDGIIPDGVFQDGIKSPITGAELGGMTYKDAYAQGLIKPKPAYQYYDDLSNWGGGIREYSVFENSWVSLREVSVGYMLPQGLTKKIHFTNLRLSVTARNIIYLYKSAPDGINPEGIFTNRAAGFAEYGGYPYVRSLGFTLNGAF